MSFQPGANLYTQGFGSRAEGVEVPHIERRDPTTTDVNYPVGKTWLNNISNTQFILYSFSVSNGVTVANWDTFTLPSGGLDTLSNGTTKVSPDGTGNIAINGTSNQITVTSNPGSNNLTLSIPSSVITPGNLTVTGDLLVNGTSSLNGAVTVHSASSDININQSVADSGVIRIGTNGGNSPIIGISAGVLALGQQNNNVNINTSGFGSVNISGGNGNTTINGSGGTGTVDIGSNGGGAITITGNVRIGQNSQEVDINTTGSGNTVIGNQSGASQLSLKAGSGGTDIGLGGFHVVMNGRLDVNAGLALHNNVIDPSVSPYTALTTDVFFNCVTSSPITINLIALPPGSVVIVADTDGLAGTNNITINAPAGHTINFKGVVAAPSATISDNFGSLTMINASDNYYVIAQG